MVYDSRHSLIWFYTCSIESCIAIQPSKALCNRSNDEEFSNEDLDKLEQYEYEVKKLSCPIRIGKQVWVYIDYKDTIVVYENNGIKAMFRYIWSGYWDKKENLNLEDEGIQQMLVVAKKTSQFVKVKKDKKDIIYNIDNEYIPSGIVKRL